MKVGILGAGQLGRMLAMAALEMGLTPCLFDPDPKACGLAAGRAAVADWSDRRALADFARDLDLCTFEFENVPVEAARVVAEHCPLRPGLRALEVSQDRLVEKEFLRSLGLATTEFLPLEPGADIPPGGILKTRRLGYDGKGQGRSWSEVGQHSCLWEKHVPFERELAQLAVRGLNGDIEFYPLVQTIQREGILCEAVAPARDLSPAVAAQARAWTGRLLEALDYVGVLALEFFLVEGRLLASEMAPRVHNSGHWTDHGCITSQFQNHLRAVAGWPLGDPAALGCCRLVNLLGSTPPPQRRSFGIYPHFYGKAARPGRKVGHITLVADTPQAVDELQLQIWEHA